MTITQRHKSSFLFLLSLLDILAYAPALAMPYPPDIVQVNRLPRSGEEALQGSAYLNRRGAGKCTELSVDQAKKMPGWAKLEKYAKDTWGDGGWNIVTNPKEYPDSGAMTCVSDDQVKIIPKGRPQCQTNTNTLHGSAAGTEGSSTVKISVGEETTSSWTISSASSFSYEAHLSVSIGIPDLFGAEAEMSASTEFTNSQGQTFTTKTNTLQESSVSAKASDGSTCDVELSVKSCQQKGNGKIRVAATGWVWFNYDSKRAPKADPKGDQHYKYAAKIDDVLTLDERSSFTEFSGQVSGDSHGEYKLHCADTKKGPANKKPQPASKPKTKDPKAPPKTSPGKKKPAPKAAPKPAPGKKPAPKAGPKPPSTPAKKPASPAPKKPAPKKPAPKKPAPPAPKKPAPPAPKKGGKK